MPTPVKPANLKSGHSKGRKERPTLGLVPVKEPTAIVPKAPAGLLAQSKKVWRSYWESQVSNVADQQADMHRLVRWIKAVDEYDRVLPVFQKERIVAGSHGQPVLNPLGDYLAKLEATITKSETEMGLTPMARLRLGITYGQAQLTADALNRALDSHAELVAIDQDGLEGEWEEV